MTECMYRHTHIHTQVNRNLIHIHQRSESTNLFERVFMCVHMCVCEREYVCVCMYVCVCVCVFAHICIHTGIHIYVYTHMHS